MNGITVTQWINDPDGGLNSRRVLVDCDLSDSDQIDLYVRAGDENRLDGSLEFTQHGAMMVGLALVELAMVSLSEMDKDLEAAVTAVAKAIDSVNFESTEGYEEETTP